MKIEKISPVERVWSSRDSISKRQKREEMIPDTNKKKDASAKIEDKKQDKNVDTVTIKRNPSIVSIEEQARMLYETMRKKDIEERRKQAEGQEKEER